MSAALPAYTVDLLFEKNQENVAQTLNVLLSHLETFLTKFFVSWGVPGTKYFGMGAGGQI